MPDDAEPTRTRIQFDHRDRESTYCPWPRWRRLRERAPIAWTAQYGGAIVLSRYRDIFAAVRDTTTFSNKQVNIPRKPVPELPPIMFDPPEHRHYREIVNPFFSPDKVAEYGPWIRATARHYCREALGADRFDVAKDIAMPVTSDITLRFLGVTEAAEDFRGWVVELAQERSGAAQAAERITEFLSGEVSKRRQNPGDDAISALVSARYADTRPLTHDEIVNMAFLLTLAGFDTTTSAITGSVWYLVQNPRSQHRLAVADERAWRMALEELVRWTSPIAVQGRVVGHDAVFQGCPVRRGEQVLLLTGSANRDETEFPAPDEVILDRFPNRHVGFGMGVHRCLGSHLAKAILRAVLQSLLEGLHNFCLAEPEEVVWMTASNQRGIRSLPLIRRGAEQAPAHIK